LIAIHQILRNINVDVVPTYSPTCLLACLPAALSSHHSMWHKQEPTPVETYPNHSIVRCPRHHGLHIAQEMKGSCHTDVSITSRSNTIVADLVHRRCCLSNAITADLFRLLRRHCNCRCNQLPLCSIESILSQVADILALPVDWLFVETDIGQKLPVELAHAYTILSKSTRAGYLRPHKSSPLPLWWLPKPVVPVASRPFRAQFLPRGFAEHPSKPRKEITSLYHAWIRHKSALPDVIVR